MTDLMKLLEFTIKEEHFYIGGHQKRVTFYFSIVTAILGATVGGAIKVTTPEHYLLLLLGPALVIAVSRIAKDGTFRIYQRFLETITIRAKLEQELGLTQPSETSSPNSKKYWAGEALISQRHLESRESYESSTDFCSEHAVLGYQQATLQLLLIVEVIAGLLALGMICLWLEDRFQVFTNLTT